MLLYSCHLVRSASVRITVDFWFVACNDLYGQFVEVWSGGVMSAAVVCLCTLTPLQHPVLGWVMGKVCVYMHAG